MKTLEDLLRATGERRLIDLCSGGGSVIAGIRQALEERMKRRLELTLTDRFPDLGAFERQAACTEGRVNFVADSVDATEVPVALEGLRTLLTSFHHFRDDQARGILCDAQRRGRPIAIFEFTERSWASVLRTALAGPLNVWLHTAAMRPVSAARLFWTYLVPLTPMLYTWDAVVSHLRSRTAEELLDLAASDKNQGR